MTTKKLLSIILSLVMILSITSVAASAVATIEPYKAVTVTASAYKNPVFKFTPEETKEYIVTSYAPEDIDPYCIIDSVNESLYIDDTRGYINFAEKLTFEAGVEYTFTIATYSEEDATFDFILACAHSWTDDTCDDCGAVCDHSTEGKTLRTCDCGKVCDADEIKLGDTVKTAFNGLNPIVLKFTPEEDVAAVFYSDVFNEEQFYDVSASIYDANGDEIAYDDDFSDTLDFVIWYEFTAGETYFLEVRTYYEDLDVEFSLVKAAHTVDDEEHVITYVDYTEGTCQEYCYTEGFYCADCDEYLAGHIENGMGFCLDDDWDDYCDLCGEYMYTEDEDDIFDPDFDIVPDFNNGADLDIISSLSKFVNNLQFILDYIFNCLYRIFSTIDIIK